ncbi:MAG: hypothetical protein ABII25_08190, partial [bacterium]
VKAFWLVNPGENSSLEEQVYKIDSESDDANKYEFSIILETGYRKVHEKEGKELLSYSERQLDEVISGTNKDIKLKSSRVYFQLINKVNNNLFLINRFLLPTGIKQADFGKIPYNPSMYGLGLGIQLLGPLFNKNSSIGTSFSWDFGIGFQENLHTYSSNKLHDDYTTAIRKDEIHWRETSFAGWISYKYKIFDIYAGYFDKTFNVFLDQGDKYQTNWRLDKSYGYMLGTQFSLNKKFSLGVETHFINEYNTAIKINFLF